MFSAVVVYAEVEVTEISLANDAGATEVETIESFKADKNNTNSFTAVNKYASSDSSRLVNRQQIGIIKE